MAVSKAQQRAVEKYMKANYDELKIRVPKGYKDQIKSRAASMGESTNGYIYRLIKEDIEKAGE